MPHPFARILGGGGEREPVGPRQAPEERQQAQRIGGIRGWLGGGRRGNDGAPEPSTAIAAPVQEMRSVGSNIVSPIPPVTGQQRNASTSPPASPLSRNDSIGYSAMGFYAPRHITPVPMQPIIERPEPAIRRDDVGISANTAEQPDEPRSPLLVNLEAQGLVRPEGKRFWQKQSWRGLQSKLVAVLISGMFLAITLAICEYLIHVMIYIYLCFISMADGN